MVIINFQKLMQYTAVHYYFLALGLAKDCTTPSPLLNLNRLSSLTDKQRSLETRLAGEYLSHKQSYTGPRVQQKGSSAPQEMQTGRLNSSVSQTKGVYTMYIVEGSGYWSSRKNDLWPPITHNHISSVVYGNEMKTEAFCWNVSRFSILKLVSESSLFCLITGNTLASISTVR